MKRMSMVSLSALAFAATAALAVGQAAPAKQADPAKPPAKQAEPAKPADQKSTEKATVVFLGNETCPGDGKKVMRDKYVETDGQRIYVCSDECMAALQ